MPVKILSATTLGLDAFPIEVEVDTTPGLYAFKIVGLPDKAVEESKERISAAINNSGFSSPARRNKKIIVNLAPADLRKEGSGFDLPIAIGVLAAMEELRPIFDMERMLFIGELGLDGNIRRVPGVLPIAEMARTNGIAYLVVPHGNANEARLIEGIEIVAAENLDELIGILEGRRTPRKIPYHAYKFKVGAPEIDFADIRGLGQVKRCLEIAAAGGHNVLFTGFPGTGKTLLAKALPGILPSLTLEEAIEITKIYSVGGLLERDELVDSRPFRSPHHTASNIAIVGGGSWPKPGEVSLAHRGVLFLDEFPEFARSVIENLRQPLEDGYITVSRIRGAIKFPARFMLIAAMNPCPCGWYGDPRHSCNCTLAKIVAYRQKISGPILDRIDLYIEVPRTPYEMLAKEDCKEERSEIVRLRVEAARDLQRRRFTSIQKSNVFMNAEMHVRDLMKLVALPRSLQALLKHAADAFSLTPRSIHRVIKVSRTIADLEGATEVKEHHITEALQYRPKEEMA